MPFVVYAAEQGYDYVGDKYWPPFEAATPGWEYQHRDWLRSQFVKFADQYGGARPEGAFAGNFPIIAWPITHAVLPTYLQRHLAKLLYEFRTGLSTRLLSDPDELGNRLAARSRGYTERFRIFCQNTELLGQVAVALLAGEDEDSPYLIRSTLDRVVNGLSREQQARRWLASARQSASHVRSSGFKSSSGSRLANMGTKLPNAADPRLLLRYLDGAWNAYAALPDLTVLSGRLPHVFDELEHCRASVSGVPKKLARGRLVHGGQEVQFQSWPDTAKPFIEIEGGSESVNRLVADQCVMTHGAWWLFRRRGAGLAIEIRGRVLRPGHRYVLVCSTDVSAPTVGWSRSAPMNVSGVTAYALDVPKFLTDEDVTLLDELGLAAESSVAIRPVGVVASSWDGEGAAEWLAGESAIIGIRSELLPAQCLVSMAGDSFFVDWPASATELVLALEGLDVGTHELNVALFGASHQELSSGSLMVTIRDPQIRPETATLGEGIRLLASPARPTLGELWDEEATATVVIDGQIGSEADLQMCLRDGQGAKLAVVHRAVRLPVDEHGWGGIVRAIRAEQKFRTVYEEAESCVLSVARGGVGFASLTCERDFLPLRWRFKKGRDGSYLATLTDRTGGDHTKVEFLSVESPGVGVSYASDAAIRIPARGGLLRATSDEAEVVVVAPTNPNAMLLSSLSRSSVQWAVKSPAEIVRLATGHSLWVRAKVPQDAFAARQRELATDAFSRSIVCMVCGNHWANLERKVETADDPANYFDEMCDLMGTSEAHKSLGRAIARNLWGWLSPGALAVGFSEVAASALTENGVRNQPTAGRFLLTLAGRPGYILDDWNEGDRAYLLERVVASPVLLRAARFAVLGTRILNDQESALRGF
ncbi:MAG: hypothetical protein HHJ11_11220 [Phycicoccus sp.]|nr:hypothetical protein [Phycicoccus sp.]